MCSGNGGHGGADLEPKLDLILWLGSLRLTCQGLLGFSAASFKGMLLVALCVHVDPASVPGWQGRKRSGQPEAEVPKLWELPAGLPHRSPSHLLHLRRVCVPETRLLPAAAEEKTARCKHGSQSGARLLGFLSLKVARRSGWGALSHTGCPINSALPPFIRSRSVSQGHRHHLAQIRQVRGQQVS